MCVDVWPYGVCVWGGGCRKDNPKPETLLRKWRTGGGEEVMACIMKKDDAEYPNSNLVQAMNHPDMEKFLQKQPAGTHPSLRLSEAFAVCPFCSRVAIACCVSVCVISCC